MQRSVWNFLIVPLGAVFSLFVLWYFSTMRPLLIDGAQKHAIHMGGKGDDLL